MTSEEILALLNEGVASHRAGRIVDAEATYRQALTHSPRPPPPFIISA